MKKMLIESLHFQSFASELFPNKISPIALSSPVIVTRMVSSTDSCFLISVFYNVALPTVKVLNLNPKPNGNRGSGIKLFIRLFMKHFP
jgi:hypothetical protein